MGLLKISIGIGSKSYEGEKLMLGKIIFTMHMELGPCNAITFLVTAHHRYYQYIQYYEYIHKSLKICQRATISKKGLDRKAARNKLLSNRALWSIHFQAFTMEQYQKDLPGLINGPKKDLSKALCEFLFSSHCVSTNASQT